VLKDKAGRVPGELGVSKSVECGIFPFSAETVGDDLTGLCMSYISSCHQ